MTPKTIFDIDKTTLPIKVYIIALDYTKGIEEGTLDRILYNTKEYLLENSDYPYEELIKIPDNTKSISIRFDERELILNNLNQTLMFTVDNLFMTGYLNGIKLIQESNN